MEEAFFETVKSLESYLGLEIPTWGYWLFFSTFAVAIWSITLRITGSWILSGLGFVATLVVLTFVGLIPLWIPVVIAVPLFVTLVWRFTTDITGGPVEEEEEEEQEEEGEGEKVVEPSPLPRHWRTG